MMYLNKNSLMDSHLDLNEAPVENSARATQVALLSDAIEAAEGVRRDYEDLKKRVDWLTISIVGAALTFVLETIFTR